MSKNVPGYEIKFYGCNTMGEKGQVVFSAQGRQSLDLNPGDKLVFLGNLGKKTMIVAKQRSYGSI
jgi:bifunctional DNA-binding transcriptional regulator/antitoxin component of YhaV-PrlF toxin-antitoxin module